MTQSKSIPKGSLIPISIASEGVKPAKPLTFQYNPTSITEKRGVRYNFSEGQGQVLPFAQYGMIEPTEITFELFMLNNHKEDNPFKSGLQLQIRKLRGLTVPKNLSRNVHYQQVSPHKYLLHLRGYGSFVGVVNSVEITTDQMQLDLTPSRLTASLSFTVISSSFDSDVEHLKTISTTKE